MQLCVRLAPHLIGYFLLFATFYAFSKSFGIPSLLVGLFCTKYPVIIELKNPGFFHSLSFVRMCVLGMSIASHIRGRVNSAFQPSGFGMFFVLFLRNETHCDLIGQLMIWTKKLKHFCVSGIKKIIIYHSQSLMTNLVILQLKAEKTICVPANIGLILRNNIVFLNINLFRHLHYTTILNETQTDRLAISSNNICVW